MSHKLCKISCIVGRKNNLAKAEKMQSIQYQTVNYIISKEADCLFIDHPTQQFHSLPLGGADTDKLNSSAELVCILFSLSHLTAMHGSKGGVSINFEA